MVTSPKAALPFAPANDPYGRLDLEMTRGRRQNPTVAVEFHANVVVVLQKHRETSGRRYT